MVTVVTMVTMVTMVTIVTMVAMVTMVPMGGDLQPGSFADRLLTGLGQPQINPLAQREKENVYCSAEKGKYERVGC